MTLQTRPNFFASCSKHLEELLEREANTFGCENIERQTGGIYFSSSHETCLEFLLHSRISSRIFMKITEFSIQSLNELYGKVKDHPWQNVFPLNQTFKIKTIFDSNAKRSFKNSILFSQKAKDGVVDHFREKTSKRPSVDTQNPDISILIRVEETADKRWKVIFYLDLCHLPLSQRGYRKNSGEAPLRENLAAGIIMLTDWDPKKDLFIDSMCGSGTLSIEAVLISAQIPPTFLKIKSFVENKDKPFSFLKHSWFNKNKGLKSYFNQRVESLYEEIEKKTKALSKKQFYASDWDNRVLNTARENFQKMNFENVIHLKKQNALKLPPPNSEEKGIIICNPPYGIRLGEEEKLKELYRDYGENLKKNFKGFRAYIFTGNMNLRKQISLSTSKRIPLFNGTIECRLLKYDLY